MSDINTENQPEKKSKFFDPKSNGKALIRLAAIVFILVAGIWLFFRFTAGEKTANRVTSAILQRPIELRNSVESVKSSSWTWIPLTLPYTGTLTVDATVLKGNDLDIFVVQESEIEKIKAQKPFTHIKEFEGNKTKNFKRSSRLPSGTYYLVCYDSTLGILSAKSSDLQIKAKLEP